MFAYLLFRISKLVTCGIVILLNFSSSSLQSLVVVQRMLFHIFHLKKVNVILATACVYHYEFTDAFYCDTNEILSEQYQRPYQYLVRLSDPTALLDTYTFTKFDISNDVKRFFSVVLR